MELGSIKMSDDKLNKISKLFEMSLNEIKGFDEKMIFHHCANSKLVTNESKLGNAEKLLYEKLLNEKDLHIQLLKDQLNQSK